MKQEKIKNMILSSLLVALSFVLAAVGPGLNFLPPPFSATLASHVPTMIACFVDPYTAILTAVGSACGFLIKFPNQNGLVIAARALSHIIFALFISFSIKKGMNKYIAFSIAAPIHAAAEAIIVMAMLPITGLPKDTSFLTLVLYLTFFGTIVHHVIDSIISLSCVKALDANGLLRRTSGNKS